MTFLAAVHDRQRGKVVVWERPGGGASRIRKEHQAPFYFYCPDRLGEYETITGVRVKKVSCHTQQDYDQEVMAHAIRFESDFEPLERVLMDVYSTKPAPVLNVGFLDIEVDYDSAIGWSRVDNPYAPINALTLKAPRIDLNATLVVPPPGWTGALPDDLLSQGVVICESEKQLLETFLDLLHEIDVISGWNSEFFDIPYIGKRIELVLGKHMLGRLAFEQAPPPRWTEKARFKHSKEKDQVLDLGSRVHLDYMLLFQKFNLTKRQSYSLSSVAQDELNEDKISYPGTLEELYHNDFELFVRYNIHDVTLLLRLDDKFKYIELANQMVHEATVNFKHVFGSVQLIDSAIINFVHNRLKKIVIDRQVRPEGDPVEGALVMTPKPDFYKWIGACDINSLYPSTIRSLNLSPEKIIGQLLGTEADWRKFYEARKAPDDEAAQNQPVTIKLDSDPEPFALPVGELVKLCNEQKYAISAFGTILDQGSGEGVLASVLTYWFNGRKEMQAEKKRFNKLTDQLEKEHGREHPETIKALEQATYYDMLQGVRKVLLNSTYGALLNEYMRFGDPRLGASTTYSGRQVTSCMIDTTSRILTIEGEAPKIIKQVEVIEKEKRNGTVERKVENTYTVDIGSAAGPIYGDTDSVYFTMRGLTDDRDEAVELANQVAAQVNDAFPTFMREAFNCQPGFDGLIKANRELVCRTGILQAKKKYMMATVDKEGKRIEPGDDDELKTMGSDIKLSSTPEIIRKLLTEVVMMVLNERPKSEIDEVIIKFRTTLKDLDGVNPLDLSTVVSVNDLDEHQLKWERIEQKGMGKVNLPSNARAAINHNYALQLFNVKETPPLKSQKVKILWLLPNELGFTNIAFASETESLPRWFRERFQADMKAMEQKLVDQKLKNIFDALQWDVPTFQSQLTKRLLDLDD